jgi:hypothetical protein
MLPPSSGWRQHVPLKRWYPTTTLHGVTTQKTSTWNITAVKASKLKATGFDSYAIFRLFSCNKELHNLHPLWVMKWMRMRWAGYVLCMGEVRNVYDILVRKSQWKKQFGGGKFRWQENIKMDVREIKWYEDVQLSNFQIKTLRHELGFVRLFKSPPPRLTDVHLTQFRLRAG